MAGQGGQTGGGSVTGSVGGTTSGGSGSLEDRDRASSSVPVVPVPSRPTPAPYNSGTPNPNVVPSRPAPAPYVMGDTSEGDHNPHGVAFPAGTPTSQPTTTGFEYGSSTDPNNPGGAAAPDDNGGTSSRAYSRTHDNGGTSSRAYSIAHPVAPGFNGPGDNPGSVPDSGGRSSGGTRRAAAAPPPGHFFTLIKSDNGDPAVYVLNNRGERFHVSEALSHEMQAGGSWYEPEVRPDAEVSAMTMRYTVDSTANLATINNAVVGNNMMLVKGDAAGNPDNSVLVGNGNAMYAVNEHGEKYHVTEAAYNKIITDNGGIMPEVATITQTAVDSTPIQGPLNVSASGALITTDPLLEQALVATANVLGDTPPVAQPEPAAPVVAPAAPAAPAPAMPQDEALAVSHSAESTGQFRIVKGNGPDLPDDQLAGNGRAVYVVNAAGQKFHVTGALHDQMVGNGTWKEPEVLDQGSVDGMQSGSSVSLSNLEQLRSINIGAGTEFKLVKGNGGDMADDQLTGNGRAVFAITSSGDKYHVTGELANKMGGAFSNVETLNQSEVDRMGNFKGSVSTVADFNKAVKTHTGGGFAGDTSGMPGGIPPIQGYPPQ